MGKFLENFDERTGGEYREMRLRNICVHGKDTGEWIFVDTVLMSVWSDIDWAKQGTYRYGASDGVFTAETLGLGDDVCAGQTETTARQLLAVNANVAPDLSLYTAAELGD